MLDTPLARHQALMARFRAARSAAQATLEHSRRLVDRSAGAWSASARVRATAAAGRVESRRPLRYSRITGLLGTTPVEVVVRRDGSVSASRPLPIVTRPLAPSGPVLPPPDPLTTTLAVSRACDRVDSVELFGAGWRTPDPPVRARAHLDRRHQEGGAAESAWPLLRTATGEDADGEHVLYLHGELDLSTAGQVQAAVDDAVGSLLVTDLSGLTFMDAAGLTALLVARRSAEARGHEVRLRGARGIVRRVFDVVGLDGLLDD